MVGIFSYQLLLFTDSFTRCVLLVHFWAPTFKWGISIANIADFAKPPEKISYPQQIAVTATGLIWSRYSLVITPKNWNLFSVNVAMAGTGLYQLSRKIR
ncbi:Mitochondrial pyruvate carrier 2 [Capsicum annuum]|uniref:Mitochondrial pyruvate carrier n=1 Tax=Capsicum annuum TaxID=4072 RepID=A0A2G2Y4G7_CAPAN|nr:Mitochondrial pyruvate carrier 2 [Capsicum annuum]